VRTGAGVTLDGTPVHGRRRRAMIGFVGFKSEEFDRQLRRPRPAAWRVSTWLRRHRVSEILAAGGFQPLSHDQTMDHAAAR